MGDSEHARTEMRTLIREFLSSRRARLTPEQVGLPANSGNRRVNGLRREEVAALAGISVEYYIRLERGDARNVSESVLQSVSRALELDEAEHAHLLDLVRVGGGIRPCNLVTDSPGLRPPVQRILDSMTTTPAVVLSGNLDVLGTNALGRALYQPMYGTCGRTVNIARFVFLDPASRAFWRDWDKIAADSTNALRAEAGRNPCDRSLTNLANELSAVSEDFRACWARHDVLVNATGIQRIHHPVVGDIDLPFESTPLIADPGQTLLMYTAEPGTISEDSLRLLASWAAPHARANET